MSNPFTNWLQNRKFSAALNQGKIQLAQEILEKKQISGAKLSLLEKIFRDKVQFEQSSSNYEREVLILRAQVSQNSQLAEQLTNTYKQLEQSIKSAHNQIKRKEQEAILIQQRLEERSQQTQGLQNQLKHKKHEVKTIQQQLERRNQENSSLQKHLALSVEETDILSRQIKHKEQEAISIQQQLTIRDREIVLFKQQLETFKRQIEDLQIQLEFKNEVIASIQIQTEVYEQEKQNLLNKASQSLVDNPLLNPNEFFIFSVRNNFKFNRINDQLLQCTGIDSEIFYDLEKNIDNYLKAEFERYTPKIHLKQHLKKTYNEDIFTSLKRGRDPEYNSYLSPHIYFMKYFLEGVYSAYLAWFLVYESNLLRTKVNILDIGAGSGAMIYGLFSFFKSAGKFEILPETHVSYCSLEQQNLLQHHGLEFWKQYIEKQNIAINTFYRFKTTDLFTYGNNENENRELPNNFFDFVVISHCIFAEEEQRIKSHQVYRKIFSESLKKNGYVLIIVQGRRLFQAYSRNQTENQFQEERLVEDFMNELDLKLEWYKYPTSTGKRVPSGNEFGKFAKENLPKQSYMSPLLRQYLDQKYDSCYVLDDYAILAKKI